MVRAVGLCAVTVMLLMATVVNAKAGNTPWQERQETPEWLVVTERQEVLERQEGEDRRDSLLAVFWNVENFFDWRDDGKSDSDKEFSAEGARHWTRKRFYAKCNAIAKTVLLIAQQETRMPDILCFAEVENRFVLNQLISSTLLHKAGYSVVHFESPDTRGIDCGLLFRDEILSLVNAFPRHLYGRDGHILTTRDILVAEFDSIAVLVNHHPSKIGGAKGGNIDLGGSNGNAGSPPDKEERRATAMATMKHLCDSLPQRMILSIGDFNEDHWHSGEKGTIKYNGVWEKIDGCFTSGFAEVRERICDERVLTVQDRAYGGEKPLRTYAGPKYTGGVSDHYPIAVMLYF